MSRKKINMLVIWFILIFAIQISFGMRALSSQFDLNNGLNIKDDLLPVSLVDTPENITDQVLILFVDGMRYDRMLEVNTPNMDRLRANGTTFSNFYSIQPSYSRVNYAGFSTGSTTNITDVYANGYDKELEIPTFYDIIKTTDISTGLVTGGGGWKMCLERSTDVLVKVETEYHGVNQDALVRDAALTSIENNFTKIQMVTFSDVDGSGHEFGGASDEYTQAIINADTYIGEIIDLYASLGQLENTTVIVFSDHGMLDVGGHGGLSEQESHASLIISGMGIKSIGVIDDNLTRMNDVIPTILTMMGLPLAPSMNGAILFDIISTSTKTNAIYSIQKAEIMLQHFNISLTKVKLLSAKTKMIYTNLLPTITSNITEAKSQFAATNYNETMTSSQLAEQNSRLLLSQLFFQYGSVEKLARNLMMIGIFVLLSLTIFILIRKKIIEITHFDVFTKELIIPEILGSVIALLVVVIMFVIGGFNYGTSQFNSVNQALIPNLTAFFILLVLGIFLPWLFVYLRFRKEENKPTTYKEWQKHFLRASVGSIAFLSVTAFAYVLYYISKYGPWPGWQLPDIADFYGFMVIANLSSFIYIAAFVLMLIIWLQSKKQLTNIQNNTEIETEK
ncbi:MAG: alkaline phosphatase family protein [Candidatus Heimdallarchaeota archaeon]